ELDPEQHEVRWRMACCQLEISRYDKALGHFEQIRRRRPDDPEVLVRIARCQHFLGRNKQARDTLDRVLERDPDNGVARRTLGEIALMNSEPDEAERELRQAVDLMPDDYTANWWLHRALKAAGKDEEALSQGRRAGKLKERLDRLSEISTFKLTDRPHDPALHCEMGKLYLEMGHKEMAERWLSSALAQDPRYRPAHAALADLYDARGDKETADEHRRQAAP
ncbi:MAG TPA: tetratricopeptide repeat protein, partial [Gemmataceae bacterium]|nr:tetratricopeptide repeat protein [Gemmataceae bacterium]